MMLHLRSTILYREMIVDYYLSLLIQITALIIYVIGIPVFFICGKTVNKFQRLFLVGFIYSAAVQVFWIVETVGGYSFQMLFPIKFILPAMIGLPLYKAIFSAFLQQGKSTLKLFLFENSVFFIILLFYASLRFFAPAADQNYENVAEVFRNTDQPAVLIRFILFVVYFGWYILSMFSLYKKARKKNKKLREYFSDGYNNGLNWLSVILIINIFCVLLCVLSALCCVKWAFLVYTICLVMNWVIAGFFGLRNDLLVIPDSVNMVQLDNAEGHLIEHEVRMIVEKQLYLDPSFNLFEFSRMCGYTPQTIINYLHENKSSSFCSYVNRARVNFLIEIIETIKPLPSIDNLSLISGFTNKRAMMQAFSYNMGISFKDYLKGKER